MTWQYRRTADCVIVLRDSEREQHAVFRPSDVQAIFKAAEGKHSVRLKNQEVITFKDMTSDDVVDLVLPTDEAFEATLIDPTKPVAMPAVFPAGDATLYVRPRDVTWLGSSDIGPSTRTQIGFISGSILMTSLPIEEVQKRLGLPSLETP